MKKKVLLLFLITVFIFTPVVRGQNFDFQEMTYSVFTDMDVTALNINSVFQFENDLNKLSFDMNYNGSDVKLRFKANWLIKLMEKSGYRNNIVFSILTKHDTPTFTAGLGIKGKKYLSEGKAILYELNYITADEEIEYRVGYMTPIIENNDLILSIGNSYWLDKDLMLEVGFKANF
ncbi:MAG: hypothetical protein K9K32_00295 [Halanaerobiales bacterium]|nr:hypothetical protein [Halanaerobiales bacterium]